jgi:hypothetical protein
MPTDLEQQLPRFAEALDREAPAISVDEILSCATVAVDVDRLERPASDQVPPVAAASWGDASPGHDGIVDRVVPMELTPALAARRPARRRVAVKVALGVAAAAVLVVALAAIVRFGDEPDRVDVPSSTVPTPPPTQPPTTVPTTSAPSTIPPTAPAPTSGGMWPQSSVEEVQRAQERADAGDPEYPWQLYPRLSSYDPNVGDLATYVVDPGPEFVDRFLHEELGWEDFVWYPWWGETGNPDAQLAGIVYLRCRPGVTNPIYPSGPYDYPLGQPYDWARCAPTIDDLRYEAVSIDLDQPARQDPDGLWVVSAWRIIDSIAQTDPVAEEAEATGRLEEFLADRVAGSGAEGVSAAAGGIPLLYATTTGASYERYEIERTSEPAWPTAYMSFAVRLFADDGATVVEQAIDYLPWHDGSRPSFFYSPGSTTENGQPVPQPYQFFNGEVTVSAPRPWWGDFNALVLDDERAVGRILFLPDPSPTLTGCERDAARDDGEALAAAVLADPDLDVTEPVAASVGALDALVMDITAGAASTVGCAADGSGGTTVLLHDLGGDVGADSNFTLDNGNRMRLYLVDLPEGSAHRILAIAVVAPNSQFDEVFAAATPVLDTIEFHTT